MVSSARHRYHSAPGLAIQGTSPFTRTPCKLAYIKSCKCWQLQNYAHLNPDDPNSSRVKGSLDSLIGPEGIPLADDELEIGEVAVSSDGLLHPETACKYPHRPKEPL